MVGWGFRASSLEATGGREPALKANGGGLKPRQADASKCPFKKALKPTKLRELVDYLGDAFQASLRRACRLMELSISVYHYRTKKGSDTELRERIKEIAATRVRYGY